MAKKKVKAVKKWEQLKNKAQSIADNPDAAPSSKLQQIQKLYSGKYNTMIDCFKDHFKRLPRQ